MNQSTTYHFYQLRIQSYRTKHFDTEKEALEWFSKRVFSGQALRYLGRSEGDEKPILDERDPLARFQENPHELAALLDLEIPKWPCPKCGVNFSREKAVNECMAIHIEKGE